VNHHPADGLAWHKGKPCDGGTCVEVAVQEKDVLLRSSVTPHVVLSLSHDEWQSFLAGAKAGAFDHL
jgi:Domain of unknown function (DUF397)